MEAKVKEMKKVARRLRDTVDMMIKSNIPYYEHGTRASLVWESICLAEHLAESLVEDMEGTNGAE